MADTGQGFIIEQAERSDGLVHFDPLSIHENLAAPTAHLQKARIAGRVALQQEQRFSWNLADYGAANRDALVKLRLHKHFHMTLDGRTIATEGYGKGPWRGRGSLEEISKQEPHFRAGDKVRPRAPQHMLRPRAFAVVGLRERIPIIADRDDAPGVADGVAVLQTLTPTS